MQVHSDDRRKLQHVTVFVERRRRLHDAMEGGDGFGRGAEEQDISCGACRTCQMHAIRH